MVQRKRNNYISKLRKSYVRELRQINVSQLRNKTMQMGQKSYVANTLELRHKNRVRITSESYGRLTLGSCVTKPCKWNQKVTQ